MLSQICSPPALAGAVPRIRGFSGSYLGSEARVACPVAPSCEQVKQNEIFCDKKASEHMKPMYNLATVH